MSTSIEYIYRDASNYKTFSTVVFEGDITDAERATIEAGLAQSEHFLPDQVGLPTLHSDWSSHYDDDHIWHEIVDIQVKPFLKPTQHETISEFAARFEGITWDVPPAAAALQDWMESTPRGGGA